MKAKGPQLLLIGDGAVGKTSLIRRYYNGEEVEMSHLATVGLDFVTKIYESKLDGKKHKV